MRTRRESQALIEDVRAGLRHRADPAKAAPMQAYMKSDMPYLGVPAPQLRLACREAFARHPLENGERWQATALALWRRASHREERYVAIELTGYRLYREFQSMRTLPMYEEMITSGAWWDFVDPIAAHRLGGLLRRFPATMAAKMRRWSVSRCLWKRRSAILCQLTFKGDTDVRLLHECIAPSMQESEFFLRKAIGWALREYAKTNPAGVIDFVRRNRNALSPLSKREAVRNLIRVGSLKAVP